MPNSAANAAAVAKAKAAAEAEKAKAEAKPKAEGKPAPKDTANGRYQFSDGFLLDTVTGDLWQLASVRNLLPVPRVNLADAVPRVNLADAGQADKQLFMERFEKAVEALTRIRMDLEMM